MARASYYLAVLITLGIAALAIVVWDVLGWFAITTVPPLVSDLAPVAGTLTLVFAITIVIVLHLRGAFPSLQGPSISSDAGVHDFTLHYSWPYKLFAPQDVTALGSDRQGRAHRRQVPPGQYNGPAKVGGHVDGQCDPVRPRGGCAGAHFFRASRIFSSRVLISASKPISFGS